MCLDLNTPVTEDPLGSQVLSHSGCVHMVHILCTYVCVRACLCVCVSLSRFCVCERDSWCTRHWVCLWSPLQSQHTTYICADTFITLVGCRLSGCWLPEASAAGTSLSSSLLGASPTLHYFWRPCLDLSSCFRSNQGWTVLPRVSSSLR